MTVRYEVNPPKMPEDKILSDDDLEQLLDKLKKRVSELSKSCNGIHITDSVLGIKRISPITTGEIIRKNHHNLRITVSLRVRDKSLSVIEKSVRDAIEFGFEGILILKGDEATENPKNSGLIPSQVVKHLKKLGLGNKINLFLSLPANPNFNKIQKKIDSKPAGFITQVVESVDQVSRIVNGLKTHNFKIIPIVLFPSDKNLKSAKFLKLDWSNYKENVIDFIENVHSLTEDILVTSPNDFNGAQMALRKLAI